MSLNIVEKIDNHVPIRHALISVSDKQGLDLLVPKLIEYAPSIKIFSTGGTFTKLQEILGEKAAKTLTPVSQYTGQPETQGGLVKTLDFKIYLGLLTETHNPSHQEDLKRTEAVPIDLVIVNLYPFKKTIETPGVSLEAARSNIDIGGPCMIRASAKNFHRVTVLVNPDDYSTFTASVDKNNGCTCLEERFNYAAKAFQHTAEYDRQIMEYLHKVHFPEEVKAYSIQPG